MIVPGSVNPLFLAMGGDPLDEFGKIARSVRTRVSAGGFFSWTPSVTAGEKKFSIRFQIKRGSFGTSQGIVHANGSTSAFKIYFNAGEDYLWVDANNGGSLVFAAKSLAPLRDPAAWYDVQVDIDTTQATKEAGVVIKIDGVAGTQFSSSNWTQNASMFWNSSGYVHSIGRAIFTSGTTYYFDGHIAYPANVAGAWVPSSAFAKTHPRTGQWRPKNKGAIRAAVAALGGARNGWGTNGFFLPLDDATSTTTLGYDRSQSDTDTTGNNFTATNISLTAGAAYDSMLDSPTNNFCTLNPLEVLSGSAPTNGGLTASGTGEAPTSTLLFSRGEWYLEAKFTARNSIGKYFLLRNEKETRSIGYCIDGDKIVDGATSAYGATYDTGVVIGIKPNADAGTIEFFRSGVSQGVVVYSFVGDSWGFSAGAKSTLGLDTLEVNFGQQPFYYPANQGTAKTLCTKNLPIKPAGPMKSSSAFVAVTDSGANIAATLAAASLWTDYIRIIKRRDASEGWRWIFSDDPTNYLDSSSTAAKAAVPAFGGTSYVGYGLKVSAANGIATGRLTHVNGVADVVSDGLANSRKMVFLKNEATGSWFVYHPELTAGKLVYLEQATIETTDATLSNVTASGFTVAAALASGTYRWVSIAEMDGGCKLFKYTGNAAADGQFVNCGHQPTILCAKGIDSGASLLNWIVHDTARDTKNVMAIDSYFNSSGSEITSPNFDAVSNGIKGRWNTSADPNVSGTRYIGFSFPAFPFRYANAR